MLKSSYYVEVNGVRAEFSRQDGEKLYGRLLLGHPDAKVGVNRAK